MKIPTDDTKPIVTGLKRAHGHLHSDPHAEEGQDCEDVLTQLAAVNKALGCSGYALVATGLQHCIATEGPEKRGHQETEKNSSSPSLNTHTDVVDRCAIRAPIHHISRLGGAAASCLAGARPHTRAITSARRRPEPIATQGCSPKGRTSRRSHENFRNDG